MHYLRVPTPAAKGFSVAKGGHGIVYVRNDLSTCRAHEGVTAWICIAVKVKKDER